MENRNVVCLIVFLMLAIARADEPYNERNPSVFDRQIITAVSTGNPDIEWVTPENREAVVRRIKLFRSMPSFSSRVKGCGVALVKLGDEETIVQAVKDFHDDTAGLNRWGGDALFHGTVEALPYLINDLYSGESKLQRTGDVVAPSQRQGITSRILGIIGRSKDLPPETREWSRSFNRINWVDVEKSEDMARTVEAWWEHNGNAIKAKKYADAKWLPPQAEAKTGGLPDPDEAKRVLPRNPRGNKEASQGGTGVSKPTPSTPLPNTGEHALSLRGWMRVAGIAVLIATAAGWLLFYTKNSKGGK